MTQGIDLQRVHRSVCVAKSGKISGVITNRDVLRQVGTIAEGRAGPSGFEKSITKFMVRDVLTISADDDIRTAANMMMIFGVGGLIICDPPAGRVGLVTERDLIRTLAAKKSVGFLTEALQFELEVWEGKLEAPREG